MTNRFYKLQGTGNDFIFFLAEESPPPADPAIIAQLCSRRRGIGADGVVVLTEEVSPDVTHRWDFYNADGSEAEMCGNAARCATRLLASFGKTSIKVRTRAGIFNGSLAADGDTNVEFKISAGETRQVGELFDGRFPMGYLTNTGVPHCVIPVRDPWGLTNRAEELAPFIFDTAFSTAGANLTFVNWDNKGALTTVTLERGVNDFTLACGTGVIAAAKVFSDLYGQSGWRTLETPGVFFQ